MLFALFGRRKNRCAVPVRTNRPGRLQLTTLEGRDVPAVIYQETFTWTEGISIGVTVEDADPSHPGRYVWQYAVQDATPNDPDPYSYYDWTEFEALFTLYGVATSDLSDPAISSPDAWPVTDWYVGGQVVEWVSETGTSGAPPAFVTGGGVTTYSFTSPPVPIVNGTGEFYISSYGGGEGVIVVPGVVGFAELVSYDFAWDQVDASQTQQSLPLTGLEFVYNGVTYTEADLASSPAAVATLRRWVVHWGDV